MSVYKISQWILIFFIYSFFGWVWETGLKSVQMKKYVNRGYLNGPWLPIYGFGALLILFVTLPFKANKWMVFFSGMVVASIFELLVGVAMETMFHVRYWDYTKVPFNIRGYICLPVSFCWGVLALVLVYIVDKPIYHLTTMLPTMAIYIIDVLLSLAFIDDVVFSTVQAFHLKKVLKHTVLQFEDLDEFKVNEKVISRMRKVLHRNPSLLSKRYELHVHEINEVLDELQNQLKNK